MKNLWIKICALFVLTACSDQQVVEWIATTPGVPWQKQHVEEITYAGDKKPDAIVDVEHPGQEIEGFGACFNELGCPQLQAGVVLQGFLYKGNECFAVVVDTETRHFKIIRCFVVRVPVP